MLVKFLSFVATVFGTAKYKAILVSSFALLLSVSSILAVVMTQPNSKPRQDASTVIRSVADSLGVQEGTVGVSQSVANGHTGSQPLQTPSTQQTAPSNTVKPKPVSSGTSTSQSSSTAPSSSTTITTTTKTVTLSAGQTSSNITYATSDSSSVTWTVVPSDSTNLTITPTPGSQASSSITFQVAAGASAPSNPYVVTVTAKDASGTTVNSSTLNVTVQ